MGLDPWEQAVLIKWKRLKNVHTYLRKEIKRVNHICFQNELPLPQPALRRMKFSKSLNGAYLGADYKPPSKGEPARIGIFPFLLLKKRDVTIAIAHEMVHHWEFFNPARENPALYPNEVDYLIRLRFHQRHMEEEWREKHSNHYLEKSWEVARILRLPFEEFLFR